MQRVALDGNFVASSMSKSIMNDNRRASKRPEVEFRLLTKGTLVKSKAATARCRLNENTVVLIKKIMHMAIQDSTVYNVVNAAHNGAHVRIVEHKTTLGILANGEGVSLELYQRVLYNIMRGIILS